MKSLEIVNKLIIQSKRGMFIDNNEEELETIKQDLEILEILRRKEVDINKELNKRDYQSYLKKAVNYRSEMILTREEFHKLKQWLWLEENEGKEEF